MTTSDLVVGVNPGVNGSLALLMAVGTLVEVVDMPTLADGAGGSAELIGWAGLQRERAGR